jgi:hypothetical protein
VIDSARPSRCECPHCRERKYVVDGKLEDHNIIVAQIADDHRSSCTLTYRCPASGAVVSQWERIR